MTYSWKFCDVLFMKIQWHIHEYSVTYSWKFCDIFMNILWCIHEDSRTYYSWRFCDVLFTKILWCIIHEDCGVLFMKILSHITHKDSFTFYSWRFCHVLFTNNNILQYGPEVFKNFRQVDRFGTQICRISASSRFIKLDKNYKKTHESSITDSHNLKMRWWCWGNTKW